MDIKTDNRPPLTSCLMEFAKLIRARSSCIRLHVGCVITSKDLKTIYSYGYNGNAAGFPNKCDSEEAGALCGCIHAETNALIKCPIDNEKVVFVTTAPCKMCAKMIVNSGASMVYYYEEYKSREGLDVLDTAGIPVIKMQM